MRCRLTLIVLLAQLLSMEWHYLPTADATKTFQVGEGTTDTMSITFETVDVLALFGADNTALAVDTDAGGADVNTEINVETDAGNMTRCSSASQVDFDVTASLVDADHSDFNTFTVKVDTAIGTLNGFMNQVGMNPTLSIKQMLNLVTEAITANSAARSRIMDTDFAKEQSNSIRLQILQQTATAALSQANFGQAVLGFLG